MQNKVYFADWDYNIPGHTIYFPHRKDITTEVTGIKAGTFHYRASAANNNKFRVSGTYSSYIEFEYYASNGVTVQVGDMLGYVQSVDVDNSFQPITPNREIIVAYFNVTSVKKKKDTYAVVAYDDVALLDVDFSATLKANAANFPMTIDALLTLAANSAGITMPQGTTPLSVARGATVQYFYADGITVRDIFNWYTELEAVVYTAKDSYVTQTSFGTGNANGWQNRDKYIVCPDDATYTISGNTAINVWYKEGGMEIENGPQTYDGVSIVSSSGRELGYYYATTPPTNVYLISSNQLADNIVEFAEMPLYPGTYYTFDNLAQFIYNKINILQSMTYAKIQLFPFRCPFGLGGVVYCTTGDGTQFRVPVLFFDLSDTEVTLGAYGFSTEESEVANPSSDSSGTNLLLTLLARVNDMEVYTERIVDTTNSNGNIVTTLEDDVVVLSATRKDGNGICTAYWSVANSKWAVHVANMSGSGISNTSCEIYLALVKNKNSGVISANLERWQGGSY